MQKNLFISGFAKCGTSSLAEWFVRNELAEYLVEGFKEPGVYERSDFGSFGLRTSNGWLLDATVSYSVNPAALARMPEQHTKIVLCFRNPWERLFSHFRMRKLETAPPGLKTVNPVDHYPTQILTHAERNQQSYPKKKLPFLQKYLHREAERMWNSDFPGRIAYELAFYFSHGGFPFHSILSEGRYFRGVKNVLEKYNAEDVIPVCVPLLEDDALRAAFLNPLWEWNAKRRKSRAKMFSRVWTSVKKNPIFPRRNFPPRALSWLSTCKISKP
ncbi:MAG: hypothetical protein LBG69_01815 [Zoogloeaceae bacterium]|jgi:hypothetical protein|nr:hypothetical protein [Zoogloeaceae bacterium]